MRSSAGMSGVKRSIERPTLGELFRLRVEPRLQPGEIRRAQRRRFQHRRPVDGRTGDVGQALHRPIARRHAAVGTQHGLRCRRTIAAHRLQQVVRLEAHRLQRRARQLVGAGVARQPKQRAAAIGVPVRRAEPDERRHQHHVLLGIGFARHASRLGGTRDHLQAIAQPLHGGAGDEDRAFQRVRALTVELIGDRRQQPMLRRDGFAARVEHSEAARPVGRLQHARAQSMPGRWWPPADRRPCRE